MIKHKLLTLFVALVAITALWASNTITYTATEDLSNNVRLTVGETTFGSAITSHTFSNGIGTITCEGEITTIGSSAFSYCRSLTSLTIPNSVTTIGEWAFSECSGLTSITIPNSATTIGSETFDGCSSLTSVTIGNSVKTIGRSAFYNCKSLTSVTIPNSVTTIGDGAFLCCFGLTSVTIGNSVTTIGNSAFSYCCLSSIIIPNSVTTIGNRAFESCGLTSVTIGNSVTTIGDGGFLNCSGLTSVTIPNSVTTIGSSAFSYCRSLTSVIIENYFTSYSSNSFPSSTKIVYTNPITISFIDKTICSVTAAMSIPSIYDNWYNEIGLSYSKSSTATHDATDRDGEINLTGGPFSDKTYYVYAKKGAEYVYKDAIRVSTALPSLSCSSSSTQTTITLSNISASTDTSVHSLSKGIYYNYKRYEADENNKVVITGIVPNTKCTLQIYGCYNGNYYYGDSKYITTQAIAPTLTVTESPTCVYAKGSYTHGDATILGTSMACTTTGSSVVGDEGLITGLNPNTSYSLTYSVDTKEGGTYTATKTITTSALTLTTLTPKVVSAGNVVVAASTNISDLETNVGFEWRKYNAPPELPSSRAQAILYNGQMEGILHNLSLEYWRVRAYYEAADGTCYYGEWATFDPSQPAFFEPTVHTYALVTDPTANKVQIRGYVMTGTDDVTEQGFEYWFKGAKAPRRVASATPDSVYRVQASGQVMTAVLEDLAYSTTYTCRAYAIAGAKTYYGEEVQFLTPEDPRPIYTLSVIAGENGSVNTDISGQYREGEIVTLTATPMAGYHFLQWSDGNTDNPRQLTIMADTELVALFELADGLEQLIIDNAQGTVRKFIHNNQLFIFHNGNLFTATGARVK